GDPAGARLRADRLRPVERRGRVRQLALAVVECALRPPDAAEIETQNGKPALGEVVVRVVDNLIVHGAAKLRMRVEHDRNRRPALFGWMKTTLQPTGGTVKENLGHENSRNALMRAWPIVRGRGSTPCGVGSAHVCLEESLGPASEAAS